MSDLPFEMEDEEKTPPEPATLVSNVLIVDDEPVVRDVFQRLLAREQDMVVSVAEDAEQGLELVKKQRFELLITDKNLPGMSGIELIAEARALRPQIEAVMITGYASSESLISAFAAGASDYLVKPFDDLKVVRAKVRAALQRRLDRRQSQISSKDMARQAAALLGQGKDASEAAWRKLDTKFAEYEHAIRDGGGGSVIVVGTDRTVGTLAQGGVQAYRAEPNAPEVLTADVVVIETGPQMDWHPLAEKLMPLLPDVVLVAGPESDLSDLLEAISLRVDLVGFGGHAPARLLPDRVRANLMRRSVERAQKELAIALHEFKQSLRERQEMPPEETAGGSPVAVSPPLAALAAVPLVNRPATPAGPAPIPLRSPVTPQIPMQAVVARPPAAAPLVPGTRSPVTPSAPMPATSSAPGEAEPETPGPAAPKHKSAAPAKASTPAPRLVDAGGAPKAAAPATTPAAGSVAAPRRPTGSHPQLAPPEEPPAAAPGGAKRPTGWHPIIPLENVAEPAASGTAPAPPDAGGPRHISGSFTQFAPSGAPGVGTAPRRQTPGVSPQVTPPDASAAGGAGAARRPTPVPQMAPPDAPSAAGAMRRPSGSYPAPAHDAAAGAPTSPGATAPVAGPEARRPTGGLPTITPQEVLPDSVVTPIDPLMVGTLGAARRPTGPHPAAAPQAPAPSGLPPGEGAGAPEGAAPSFIRDPVSGAIRRTGSFPAVSPDAAAPGEGAVERDPVSGAVRRRTGSFPAVSPDPAATAAPGGLPPAPPSAPARRTPGIPNPLAGGAMRRPSGPHPQAPAPPPEPEPDALPLEWSAIPGEGAPPPADPRPSAPLITAAEPEISIDDAFAEWDDAAKKPAPAPLPPAPARRPTGPTPKAAPQDNAARRKAASPFPIMSVAEAESALKAAQAAPPAPAKPPQAPAASPPARRTTGSFPAASPANPNPAPPAAAPRAPLQGRPAVRPVPPAQGEGPTETSMPALGGPPSDKPKPPNGGSH